MKYFRTTIFATMLVFFFQCQESAKKEDVYTTRVDFRFGNKFYSLLASDSGLCYAIRGIGTDYLSSFKIISSDTSELFRLDSARAFLTHVNELKKGTLKVYHNGDAPRVEIYSDGKKVYDSGAWDAQFWSMFRPIAGQIPPKYNPFLERHDSL